MALGKNLKTGKKSPQPNESGVKTEEKMEALQSKPAPISSESKPVDKRESLPTRAQDISPSKSISQLNKELSSEQELEENSRMLVVFAVGSEEYAFDIDQIKEVVPVPSISKVPQTRNYIRGVANVRGNVLAIIDLARKFGLQTSEDQNVNYVIVIKSEDIKVAVASGQVPETLMIREGQMESTADVVRKSHNEQGFIKGVINREKRMIIYIDVLEMLENDQAVNI